MTATTVFQALESAKADYLSRNPKSAAAFESACQHLPGGGTRSSLAVDPFPLYVSSGRGATLVDLDGHEYVDFVSDFTSGIYGKTNAGLHAEIRAALDNGIQLGAHTTSESQLARLLCERFPSIDSVRFTNSGTEATLLALMTAVRYTGKRKILVFADGYHGTGFSSFALHQDGVPSPVELQAQSALRSPFDFLVCNYNDLEGTCKKANRHKDDLAAILVEPMLGAGGCVPGDPDFLAGLRDLTTNTGSLLIFDEIQTARLDYSGRQGLLNIKPDLTTLGKFFGGGFAFGAFGGSADIMAMYDWRRPGAAGHGGTFNNSILTMKAGAYAAEHLLTAKALKTLTKRGDLMRESIQAIFRSANVPFRITGLGSINQLHCSLPGKEGTYALQLLYFDLLEQGFWIAQRGLLALSFELADARVQTFVQAVDAFVQRTAHLY